MLVARRILRWLFVSAAAVQVLLPASASIADAVIQREETGAGYVGPHVEEFGSKTCKRVHADDCALCRVVSAAAAPSRTLALPGRVARLCAPPAATGTRVAHAVAHALPASRAPPMLDEVAGQRA
ncbi:MAG TPA: hypothetical protein VGG78_04925 [Gemmatimonadaceae bacterium]|jgi:hypothetical protein